jgi:hypothetical protein
LLGLVGLVKRRLNGKASGTRPNWLHPKKLLILLLRLLAVPVLHLAAHAVREKVVPRLMKCVGTTVPGAVVPRLMKCVVNTTDVKLNDKWGVGLGEHLNQVVAVLELAALRLMKCVGAMMAHALLGVVVPRLMKCVGSTKVKIFVKAGALKPRKWLLAA